VKIQRKTWLVAILLTICLGWQGGAAVRAFGQEAASQSSTAAGAPEQKHEAEADSNDQFRHADNVQSIAKMFGLSTEATAQIFEWVNSGILIFVIVFFLGKTIPKALRNRTATIQKKLVEARQETETANERLTAVEAKLAKLGEEIEAVRQQSERDLVEDEKRIKQALEDERQRIVKSAEQEIESAGASAKRDLKRFAAELAVGNAAKRIELSADSDKALIERFGHDLAGQFGKGARN
jgi:F-type H+-transporting ATPase subunit b